MIAHDYYHSRRKRIFDILISLIILVVCLPIFILLLPLLTILIGKPIFFLQKRTGKNKEVFTLYKIRTMKHGANKLQEKLEKLNQAPYPMFKIKNDPRFLSIGKLFSNLGIDELPQIFNILKGDMSIVGPRPLPTYESDKLDKTWDFRYAVKPGILSFWAISKERHKSLDKWKKLEKETLKISSVYEDLKLLLNSILLILFKKPFKKNLKK